MLSGADLFRFPCQNCHVPCSPHWQLGRVAVRHETGSQSGDDLHRVLLLLVLSSDHHEEMLSRRIKHGWKENQRQSLGTEQANGN